MLSDTSIKREKTKSIYQETIVEESEGEDYTPKSKKRIKKDSVPDKNTEFTQTLGSEAHNKTNQKRSENDKHGYYEESSSSSDEEVKEADMGPSKMYSINDTMMPRNNLVDENKNKNKDSTKLFKSAINTSHNSGGTDPHFYDLEQL